MTATMIDRLKESCASLGGEVSAALDMPVITFAPGALVPIVRTLKDKLDYDMLLDVTALDWLPAEPRFEVVWHFYSTKSFTRVRLKTRVAETDATVDTLTTLYGSAAFMERECHDMYGIKFRGNGDLRPVLLYEGFVGHPLRKDYDKFAEQPLVPYRK